VRRVTWVLLPALCLLVVLTAGASAAAPTSAAQAAYAQGLRDARAALDAPGQADPERAARALSILRSRAPGEIEAIDSLTVSPPAMPVVRARLDNSLAGFAMSADDPNPGASRARLGSILAEPRYHPGEGPLAFFSNLVNRVIAAVANALFSPGPVQLLLLAVLVLMVGLALVFLVPGLRQPLTRARGLSGGLGASSPEVPAYFLAAERLAAEGEFAAAVRALAAGTMERVSGERSFTASPLTVREAFWRSGAGQTLRPLLRAFESSYYGHHEVTRGDYEAAAAAAAAHRESTLTEVAAA
jgi:hypothetical protein